MEFRRFFFTIGRLLFQRVFCDTSGDVMFFLCCVFLTDEVCSDKKKILGQSFIA